jgi:H+-translocating NAD(P) transhydrogenase subunit alpha
VHGSVALLTIFVLAAFTGYEVISKVSTTLHTPLMSGANAIHGVILVGAIIVTGKADTPLELTLGVAATVLATVNMVGGFVVTDRMLAMFSRRPAADRATADRATAEGATAEGAGTDRAGDGRG